MSCNLLRYRSTGMRELASTFDTSLFSFVSRFLPYESIESVHIAALPDIGGRWRIWGTSDFRYWYSVDLLRPSKRTPTVVEIWGWGTPVFTTKDSDTVDSIISAALARTR